MKLQVVMLDRYRTEVAVSYENQCVPYGRRLVSIELTPEQSKALEPRVVSEPGTNARFEEIGEVWIEKEPTT